MERRDEYWYAHQMMLNGTNPTTPVNNNNNVFPSQKGNGNSYHMNCYPTVQGHVNSYSYPTIQGLLVNTSNTFPQSYHMQISQQTSTQINVGMLPYGANDMNANVTLGMPVTELGSIPSCRYDPRRGQQGCVYQQAPLAPTLVGMNGIPQALFGQMQGNGRGNFNMATENVLQKQTAAQTGLPHVSSVVGKNMHTPSQQRFHPYISQQVNGTSGRPSNPIFTQHLPTSTNQQQTAAVSRDEILAMKVAPHVKQTLLRRLAHQQHNGLPETAMSELYEKTFNIRCDENAKFKWYKDPSSDSESVNRKTKSSSDIDDSHDIVEPSTKKLKVEKEKTLPLDTGNIALQTSSTTFETSKDELQAAEQTHVLKARPRVSGEEIGINVSYDKEKDNNPLFNKSRNIFKDLLKEKCPDPEKEEINEETSGSDIENSPELKISIKNTNNNDSNIYHFMKVMAFPSAQFKVLFHGRQMLCVRHEKGKYLVIRELLFHFFSDKIEVFKSLMAKLAIKKIFLEGAEKDTVAMYLSHKDVFADKTTKFIGIIHIEKANRIYHKVFSKSKCDVCIKVKEETGSPVHRKGDLLAKLPADGKTVLPTNKMKQQKVETQTVYVEETSCDSDSTFPYVDEEQPLPNPEDFANPEDDDLSPVSESDQLVEVGILQHVDRVASNKILGKKSYPRIDKEVDDRNKKKFKNMFKKVKNQLNKNTKADENG